MTTRRRSGLLASLWLATAVIAAPMAWADSDQANPSFGHQSEDAPVHGHDATNEILFFYDPEKEAESVKFGYVPPAEKIFATASDTYAVPPLFPKARFFTELAGSPRFYDDSPDDQAFSFYKIGDFFVKVPKKYSIFSAKAQNGDIHFMVRDRDGAFVQLKEAHLAVYDENGDQRTFNVIASASKNMSLLIDRSASMGGFDADVTRALSDFSKLKLADFACGLYEFGNGVDTVAPASGSGCIPLLQSYTLSAPSGSTPLFEALGRAYEDIADRDEMSVVVIISDGRPSDQPTSAVQRHHAEIPTFVLWAGDHTENYIEQFSTAHAVARQGGANKLRDFLGSVAFSVYGHQTIQLQ
jgi:hypothetical protein